MHFKLESTDDLQREFPGIPAHLPILNAGYVPNETWTKAKDVLLTYAFGKRVEWSIPLENYSTANRNVTELINKEAEGQRNNKPKAKKIKSKVSRK